MEIEKNYNPETFACKKCGSDDFLSAENEYEKVLICNGCCETYLIDQKLKRPEPNTPKCPTCGSNNVEKISTGKKAFGGAMFGLFSSDIRNSMHCKNCGAKW